MEDKAGSYVVAADGTLTPNLADEAMAERQGIAKTAAKNTGQDAAISDDGENKKTSRKGVSRDVRE
ncbi:hypothetical protein EPN18_07375 [bacterium]|nr:MAG: hypothetical protein EPN18_07375 [bacterium]